MRSGNRPALAGLTLPLALLLVACGDSGPGGSGGAQVTLTIQGFAFHPETLTAAGGEQATVTIGNEDSVTHNFTLDDGGVSRDVPPGQTVDVTVPFPATGTAGFHCKFHPSMTGRLRVA
jgi:plastocyanin